MAEYTAEQIANHYRGLILSGQVGAGDRLPTVRQTARDLGVAVATAAKAYRSLELDHVVVTKGAAGTRVANQSAVLPGAVLKQVRETVAGAKSVGVSQSELLNSVRALWGEETAEGAPQTSRSVR